MIRKASRKLAELHAKTLVELVDGQATLIAWMPQPSPVRPRRASWRACSGEAWPDKR